LKLLELFSGTQSISKVFREHGHETFTIDFNPKFAETTDICADILTITTQDILEKFGRPDVIWASPDCTSYSIAAISHHRTREESGNLAPKSDYAKHCDKVNQHVLRLIEELAPKYYFIENPRGGMRKMTFMQDLPRYTVTYCQYGDDRMKPTDIWTNHPAPNFRPMCKNGDSCHEAAPRGSKTGTQGRKNAVERSKIPEELCKHVRSLCE
jgi:site-specific DNA-cytosine methylase